MSKPTLVDLCCSAGLASEGYAEYFDVVGVDVDPQPNYPYRFIRKDVRDLDPGWLSQFAIGAGSPPCQWGSNLKHRYTVNNHINLIPDVRGLFLAAGLPYVIENVDAPAPRAELIDPIRLCGRSFPGLRVYRHRLFELGGGLEGLIPEPEHPRHDVLCHTLDKRKAHYGTTDEMVNFVQVNGGGNSSVRAARDAMGMNHRPELTKHELNEGIPPAYTAYIARYAAAQLEQAVAA